MLNKIDKIYENAIILKWKKILDSVGITDKEKYPILSKYCENHAKIEISENVHTSTLAPSLLILSKVDLDKIIFINKDEDYTILTMRYNYEMFHMIPNFIDVFDGNVQKHIIDKITNSTSTFNIGKRLISRFETEIDHTKFNPNILVKGNFSENIKIEMKITISKDGNF